MLHDCRVRERKNENTEVGAERLSFDGDGSAEHRLIVRIWGDAREEQWGKKVILLYG